MSHDFGYLCLNDRSPTFSTPNGTFNRNHQGIVNWEHLNQRYVAVIIDILSLNGLKHPSASRVAKRFYRNAKKMNIGDNLGEFQRKLQKTKKKFIITTKSKTKYIPKHFWDEKTSKLSRQSMSLLTDPQSNQNITVLIRLYSMWTF